MPRRTMCKRICTLTGFFNQSLIVMFCLLALSVQSVRAYDNVLKLAMGQQHSYQFGQPIKRIAIGDPQIADVTVIDEQQVLITPKAAGVTSLMLWSEAAHDEPYQLALLVSRNHMPGQVLLEQSGHTELQTDSAGGSLVLSGELTSLEQHQQIRQMLDLENSAQVDASQLAFDSQVQIDIKIVEISRNRLQTAGFFLGKNNASRTLALSSPGNLTGVQSGPGGNFSLLSNGFLPDSGAFNFVYGRAGRGLLGVISALESNGFAYTLAEPSLMAMSGQSANFLAGGEFPIPVRAGGSVDSGITIEYKEFGVRLSLTPTVLAQNRIALKVAPEVSELDFTAGIQSGGVAVPALRIRRTDTSIALGDGESFVISGLVSQSTMSNIDKLPGLGDIPVLGAFFRSSQLDRNDKELLMVVTPHLVRPIARDAELPELPGEHYRNYQPDYFEFLLLERGNFVNRTTVPSGFSN